MFGAQVFVDRQAYRSHLGSMQLYAGAIVPSRSLFLRALAIRKSAQIPDRVQPDDFGLEVPPFK